MPPRRTLLPTHPESVLKGLVPNDLDERDDEGQLIVLSGEVKDEDSDDDDEMDNPSSPGDHRRRAKGKGKKDKATRNEATRTSLLHSSASITDGSVVWLRAANYIAFVKTGTTQMVALTSDRVAGGCDLLAWVAPLSGGTRRATRAWLGFTPLWEQNTDQDVWYMDTRYARVHIKSMPEWTSEVVMRHR